FFDSSHCTAYDCIADGVIDNGFEMLGAKYCSFVNCKARNVFEGYAFNLWAGTKYSGCYACIAEMTIDPSTDTDIAGFKASTDDSHRGASEVITFADCITLG